ncbi:MAG TPA: hypothetical protein VK152_10835 [Paludibacter sp.]|nr:hypothetical protein [Paludibacter sp.]
MEERNHLLESLLDKAADYGKTTFDLVKLNVVDKVSDQLSTFLPHTIVFFVFVTFVLFLNLAVAFWLGEVLGHFFYGFLLVAGFYGFLAVLLHSVVHKWLKRFFYDFFVKQILK